MSACRAVGGRENTRLLNAEFIVKMVIQMPPAAAVNRMLFIQDTYFSTVTGHFSIPLYRRSQWPRGLRRRSVAAHLLRLWVRIPPGAWMLVCCECRVLSGRGLCDELITRPEESYRLWCVVVCDLETS